MSMTPQQEIESAIKTAMKAGEKLRLATLRMLLTDIKNKKIELGREVDIGEPEPIGGLHEGLQTRFAVARGRVADEEAPARVHPTTDAAAERPVGHAAPQAPVNPPCSTNAVASRLLYSRIRSETSA